MLTCCNLIQFNNSREMWFYCVGMQRMALLAKSSHPQVNKVKTDQHNLTQLLPADLLVFLADVGLGQFVGNLLEVWFKEGFGAASQHRSQHHEGGPGVRGRGEVCHMIQQQLEEDGRRDKGPQQFSSCQALDVGTDREREREEKRSRGMNEWKEGQDPLL